MDYEVKLEIFEGPLDLLLHLIHKNEVDIFDIPIAAITDQYLAYLDLMKALNINLAGDFLVMAATLIHIKSKMLLPRREEEEEDPRVEITRPLLEYMRFREAAGDLSRRDILERDVFARRPSPELWEEAKEAAVVPDVNLFQLMDAFKRIMDREHPATQLTLRLEQWSVKEKMEDLIGHLKTRGAVFFKEIFDGSRTVSEFVVTFLALLELVHMGLVKLFQASPDSDIRLLPSFNKTGEDDNGNTLPIPGIDH
ncbi:MAG: chromosome segregation protein ScpA [Deltaproteobacteria bacterium]|nr:MAG: chromosome segregation protein ScpA [Deltaproteobacteria bacterium]